MKIYITKADISVILSAITITISTVLSFYIFVWHQPWLHRPEKPYYPKLRFALSLLNSLQKEIPNENIFYSSKSVYDTLSLCHIGATGEAKKELGNLLGLRGNDTTKNITDVENAYRFEKGVRHDEAWQSQNQLTEFVFDSKLFVPDGIDIKEPAARLFNNSIEQINVSTAADQMQYVNLMNRFVENATRNYIQKPFGIENGKTLSSHQMTIVNTAYFNGKWVCNNLISLFKF